MRTSEKSATIAAALYAVHRDLENPRKDAKGQVRGKADYRYLSLPALIDHAKAALKEAQVAVIQDVNTSEHGIGVTTRFMHLTGEWLEVGPVAMPLLTANPQEIGSLVTYLRRYALAAALNLAAEEDDDAASATSSPRVTQQRSAGMGDAEERGAGVTDTACGEGAETGAPASQPAVDPQESAHPGIPHKLAASGNPNVPKNVKVCRIAGCDYVYWPEGAEQGFPEEVPP
jgi:hypothetical protein